MTWAFIVSLCFHILSVSLSVGAFNPFRNLNMTAISRSQAGNSGKGIWSQTFYCPDPTFINGINPIFRDEDLKTRNWFTSESTGRIISSHIPVFGLNVSCTSITGEVQTQIQRYIPAMTRSSDAAMEYTVEHHDASVCPPDKNEKPFGVAVGVEKRLSSNGTLMELAFYCNYEAQLSRQIDLTMNIGTTGGRWTKPFFCPWGHYLCGYKVQYDRDSYAILDFRTECCPALEKSSGWTNYRGETSGTILQSLHISSEMASKLAQVGHTRSNYHLHYMNELDDPYYYNWEFCPITTYVIGIQAHPQQRQFRFICADISISKPRRKHYITGYNNVPHDIWEEEGVSDELECQGLSIGFQVLYEETTAQIQGIRLLCSYSRNNEVPYIKAILPPTTTNVTLDKYAWGMPQMCPKHQTLCGVKTRVIQGRQGTLEGLEHLKAKCCTVPSVAQVCSPYDEYELIAECDSRRALADTTCTYTQTEGFTMSVSSSKSQNLGWDMRNSLSKEWSLTETDTRGVTEDNSVTSSQSESLGTSNTNTNSATLSQSQTNSQTNSQSEMQGTTTHQSSSNTKNRNRGRTISTGTERSRVFTGSTRTEQSFGTTIGDSSTTGSDSGTNFLNTQGFGTTVSDSSSDSTGISEGVLRGRTTGQSDSSSSGSSNSNSQSGSNTSGNSNTRGSSSSNTDGLSAGVSAGVSVGWGPVSGDLRTNFEASSSQTQGSHSDETKSSSSTTGQEQSQSSNQQVGQESSSSNQDQETRDKTSSFTRNQGTEHSKTGSVASGGHSSNSQSNTRNKEQSQTFTSGTENGWSDGTVNRHNEENTEQEGESWTNENGVSNTNQRTKEQSNTASNTVGSEKTQSNSQTNSADWTNSQSTNVGISKTKQNSNSRGQGGSATKDKTLRTGYDWSQSSESTWKQEKSHQVTMNIPPGTRTLLYQVVGRCDHFQIRANNFKREDFKA